MHSMTLQTNDATITANDVLGRIAFASPNESGAEAVKVVGKFEVQAEEAFDASNNATKMVFYLAADGDAATKMTLSSAGTATLTGNLIIADGGNIGSASDTDAIAIADDGIVSFSATSTCPATDDGTALGTASRRWSDLFLATGGVINFNDGGVALTHGTSFLTNTLTLTGSASYTKMYVDNSAGTYDWSTFYIRAATYGTAIMYFGDSSVDYMGQIRYNNANDSFSFYTSASKAITIDSSQNTEFDGTITAGKAIKQGHADATDPGNVLTIDCSLSNYFEITHSANALTAVEFENASEGQRILLQLKNGYYSGSMSSFWDDITINDDSDGDVLWVGGTEPSSAAGTTDLYGFLFSGDVKVAYGFIVGQDIKA